MVFALLIPTTSLDTNTLKAKGICEPKVGKLDCPNMVFRFDWSGVNFSGGNFEGAIFDAADLTGANFSKANLKKADFRSSKSRSAPLGEDYDPNYSICKFGNCPVDANLTRVNFGGANLNGAKLGSIESGTNFSNAYFPNATFSGDDRLRGVSFRGAYLKGSTFYDGDLTGADFSGSNLENVRFLGGSQFPLIMTNTKFKGALLTGTKFPNQCKKINKNYDSWSCK